MKNLFLNNQNKILKILIVMTITLFLHSCGKTSQASYNIDSSFENASKLYCMIDLRGEVMRPGIYKIESGSLVNDVIELAGGFTKNADKKGINLVMIITTNMKIIVETTKDEINSTNNGRRLINLNTCTKEELLEVPKIGESKAIAIINYRDQKGSFTSVDELLNISGIGNAIYTQIKVYFTI